MANLRDELALKRRELDSVRHEFQSLALAHQSALKELEEVKKLEAEKSQKVFNLCNTSFVQQKIKLPVGANSRVPSKHPRFLRTKNPIAKSNNQITNQGQASAQQFREFTSEGKKFYFCDICSYKTKIRGNLKMHINNKHNQNCVKYRCSLCGYEAKLRNNLKYHYMGVHKLRKSVAKSATADAQQV